jgi:GntR family transcriptional regulator
VVIRVGAPEITRELSMLLERGRWLPGDRLPTEAQLCATYRASRPTVRKALETLASAGFVVSQQGRGWFVAHDRRERFPLDAANAGQLAAHNDIWHAWARSIERVASHRLTVTIEEPPREVAALLDLGDQAEPLVVARKRVRYLDGEPYMLSIGWWPMWIAAGTKIAETGEGDAVDMRDPSPLKLAAEMGHVIVTERNEITARHPTAHEAQDLACRLDNPVILVATTSWTLGNRALRCTADVFPSNRFILTVGRGPS